MTIACCTNLYPPFARGGAEVIALRTVRELHARGHEVFVLSTYPFSGWGSWNARLTERHIERVYRFFPLNLYHSLNDYRWPMPLRLAWHAIDLFNPMTAWEARHVFLREKPDVVVTHNLKGLGLSLVSEIRREQIPHVHVLHDVQLSAPSGLLSANLPPISLSRRTYHRFTKRAIGSPEVVVSPSRFLADFHRDRGFFPQSHIEVLPNPAPTFSVTTLPRRQEGRLRLLFAGQLERHKGIEFLIQTLKHFELPFELHIAGEGRLADWVVRESQEDPRFIPHGFVPLDHLSRLLAICDYTVVPSLCAENSPTIIYESFQAGIPVVAAHVGGVGELVSHGTNGYLFAGGSQEELLTVLRRAQTEVGTWRDRQDMIRERVTHLTLANYVDRLEDLIEVAKNRRHSRT